MATIIDWILIVISSILFFKSLGRLLNYKSKTIADYIIVVIYIFNCLPILLDNTIGVPKYTAWFINFQIALNNNFIRIVYALYILASVICLYIYIKLYNPKKINVYRQNNSIIFKKRVLPILVYLPYLHILVTGNITHYFSYGTAGIRGLTSTFYQQNTALVFISLFSFCCMFFCRKLQKSDYVILFTYAFSLIWIDGKRYIVVTLIITFLFFLLNSVNVEHKKPPIKKALVAIFLVLIVFNSIYSLYVKPIAESSSDSMYMSYRIDYGRDDVTKFVLYRELISNDPILDYRGETFLSTIFTLVPRTVWPSKPYPHYRYLTSALYGTSSPLDIPAGMTPSLYEMSVANFGVFLGIITTIFILIFSCLWADNSKSIPRKGLYLLLIIGLLTQSMDALIVYMAIAPLSAFASWAKRSVKSKHRFKIEQKVKV
ncbi:MULTISPECIES: hypothetical protein [Priestia]|uniref:hypothetical protein n=1 Tax=Priestia TaxID=2800373 RepID=UPI001C533BFC|nr:hypothetical protein [Priestia megaterium]MBW0932042.1 hypothetical protein [Priestia megaterium]